MGGNFPPDQQMIQKRCVHPKGGWEEFTQSETEQSIGQRFEKIAARFADRLAIKSAKYAFSYAELNGKANRIARAILPHENRSGEPIALLLRDDVWAYATVLGILKAGRAFVLLDPTATPAHLAFLLQDSSATLIVTDTAHVPLVSQWANLTLSLLNLDEIDPNVPEHNLAVTIPPQQVAALFYTSGSTGQPKGVYTTHRNILQLVRRITNSLYISPEDRRGNARAFSSSMAVLDFLMSVLVGNASILYQLQDQGSERLLPWLVEEKITLIYVTMSIYRQSCETLARNPYFALSDLRFLIIGGEPILMSDIEAYRAHFPDSTTLILGYGVTELPGSTYYLVDKTNEVVGPPMPSGYPMEGLGISILDDEGNPLEAEQPGEIALSSPYLALGYWGKPALTAEKFLPDPDGAGRVYMTGDVGILRADGCLVHLGRKDFQIKIRGFRVEIEGVETALADLPGVKSVAVVAHPDQMGIQRLVAYVVPINPESSQPAALRQALATRLPDYMVPSAFVTLDALPLLPTGKVNRLALPPPDRQRPRMAVAYVGPSTPFETAIAAIWSDVLELDTIGVHDPFLDLGGNSLQAMRIAARVQEEFGVEIHLAELFAAATVAEMALVVAAALLNSPGLSRFFVPIQD